MPRSGGRGLLRKDKPMMALIIIVASLFIVFTVTVIAAVIKVASEDDEMEILDRIERRIEEQTRKELEQRGNKTDTEDIDDSWY